MKRVLCILSPILLLAAAAGCDTTSLPTDAKTLLTAQGISLAAFGDQLQTQQRLRLLDGSCTGDGNQYEYQYGGDPGSGEQLRLRDGSCDASNGG